MKDQNAITPEQELLLKLVSVKNEKVEAYSNIGLIDYKELVEQSRTQGVIIQAFSNLKEYQKYISEDVLDRWLAVVGGVISINANIYAVQKDVIEIFGGRIKYVVIKGTSSCWYYKENEERIIGDVDLLIDSEDFSLAEKLLLENGYKRKLDGDHHTVFKKSGVNVELHYEIAGIPSGVNGDKIKSVLKGVFNRAEKRRVKDVEFNAPDDMTHGLIILIHTAHHMFVEGVGIRHMLDWAYFVNKTADKSFWEEFIKLLEDIGLLKFAKALTKACNIYLNGVLPDWAKDVEDGLCKEIILDIFRNGNFGRSQDTYPNSEIFVKKDGKGQDKKTSPFVVMHRSVIGNYPFVKKWVILYPFMYAYKVIKYPFMILAGKRSSITELKKRAKAREKLYKKFQVFENKN